MTIKAFTGDLANSVVLKGLQYATTARQDRNADTLSREIAFDDGLAGVERAQQPFQPRWLLYHFDFTARRELLQRVGTARLQDDRRAKLGQQPVRRIGRRKEPPSRDPYADLLCQRARLDLVKQQRDGPIMRDRKSSKTGERLTIPL